MGWLDQQVFGQPHLVTVSHATAKKKLDHVPTMLVAAPLGLGELLATPVEHGQWGHLPTVHSPLH